MYVEMYVYMINLDHFFHKNWSGGSKVSMKNWSQTKILADQDFRDSTIHPNVCEESIMIHPNFTA